MKFENHTSEVIAQFADIISELAPLSSLGQVLNWAGTKPQGVFIRQVVSEVIVQDEFTHDVIVPFKEFFLVFDTT